MSECNINLEHDHSGTAKWNTAIANWISYTCAFQSITNQNSCWKVKHTLCCHKNSIMEGLHRCMVNAKQVIYLSILQMYSGFCCECMQDYHSSLGLMQGCGC